MAAARSKSGPELEVGLSSVLLKDVPLPNVFPRWTTVYPPAIGVPHTLFLGPYIIPVLSSRSSSSFLGLRILQRNQHEVFESSADRRFNRLVLQYPHCRRNRFTMFKRHLHWPPSSLHVPSRSELLLDEFPSTDHHSHPSCTQASRTANHDKDKLDDRSGRFSFSSLVA